VAWQSALSLKVWRNLAEEFDAIARSRRCAPLVASPAWSIAPDELARLRIRWPKTYEWPDAGKWVHPVRNAMGRRVPLGRADIAQSVEGSVTFDLLDDGRRHVVVIDYRDDPSIHEHAADGALAYFKMQHRHEGYGRDNVFPGGYVPDIPMIYRYLPYLRARRDRREYEYDVYGRFSLRFAPDVRTRAMQLLNEQERFAFEGGLKMIGRAAFLKELTAAKIAIDLPGNGAICHRLVNGLAIGSCIVGPRPANDFAVSLDDGVHAAWVRPDLSDLVERCEYYLAHDDEREAMGAAARRWFDRHLHPDAMAAHYLRTLLDRLAGTAERGQTGTNRPF
jgi:hypothetical protein